LPSETDAVHRWTLIPDAEGRMHLMDMNPIEVPVQPFFNAETDIIFLLSTRRNPTVKILYLQSLFIQIDNYQFPLGWSTCFLG
jgi:hypothetical protein